MYEIKLEVVISYLQHLLLNTAFDHKPSNVHLLRLAHSVHAIDRLGFNGEAPPGIHHEHSLRAGQVQTYAAGAQREEEDCEFGPAGEFG